MLILPCFDWWCSADACAIVKVAVLWLLLECCCCCWANADVDGFLLLLACRRWCDFCDTAIMLLSWCYHAKANVVLVDCQCHADARFQCCAFMMVLRLSRLSGLCCFIFEACWGAWMLLCHWSDFEICWGTRILLCCWSAFKAWWGAWKCLNVAYVKTFGVVDTCCGILVSRFVLCRGIFILLMLLTYSVLWSRLCIC